MFVVATVVRNRLLPFTIIHADTASAFGGAATCKHVCAIGDAILSMITVSGIQGNKQRACASQFPQHSHRSMY